MARRKKQETLEKMVDTAATVETVDVENVVEESKSTAPDLNTWKPEKEDMYFTYDGNVVKARFSDILGEEIEGLDTFIIIKKHYKERMLDITQHINYFIKFYDIEKEFVIVDSSKNNENFTCASALEEIYKDDEYIYYLPCQKSQYIKVIYAPNEYQEGLKSSLEDGTIKISDLDEFNIEYIKKERK